VEILVREDAEHILDVGVEVDAGVGKVDALAETGEGRGEDVVASTAQERGHSLPAPAAMHRAVNEHEGRHGAPPITRCESHPARETADDAMLARFCTTASEWCVMTQLAAGEVPGRELVAIAGLP
jgi:hypothetical protein